MNIKKSDNFITFCVYLLYFCFDHLVNFPFNKIFRFISLSQVMSKFKCLNAKNTIYHQLYNNFAPKYLNFDLFLKHFLLYKQLNTPLSHELFKFLEVYIYLLFRRPLIEGLSDTIIGDF